MSDPILLWNEVALEVNKVSHTNGQGEQNGPTLSSRALSIVHLAMYDAFAGIINDAGRLPRYLSKTPAPGAGASVEASVAAAAHKALSELFPSQKPWLDGILQGVGDPANSGHAFGVKVADDILNERAMDPGAGSSGYNPSPDRGRHRPDPDNSNQGFHGPFYGSRSKGFGITQRFELAQPKLDDQDYVTALREVLGKGIKPETMGTLPAHVTPRIATETLIGIFWAYDGASQLGTPPRLYNQIVRSVAISQKNNPEANARLFAFVNVAMADAGILAWDQKYRHDFWRPVVGIREHDRSMGPGTTVPDDKLADDCDPLWLPLGAPNSNRIAKNFTPPFPAYPSGHATFGAAALHITRLFYKQGGRFNGGKKSDLAADRLFDGSDLISDELNSVTTDNAGAIRPKHRRAFPKGLWQMIEENGRSRVFLGVHWVFDAFAVDDDGDPDLTKMSNGLPIGGVPLGLLIAEDIFDSGNGLAPKQSNVGPRKQDNLAPGNRTPTFSSIYLR